MAKNKPITTPTPTTNPTPTEAPEAPQTIMAQSTSELATAPKGEVVEATIEEGESSNEPDDNSLEYLAMSLPHLQQKLLTLKRVDPDALDGVVKLCSDREQKLLAEYQQRISGSDDTSGEGGTMDFMAKIPNAKLFQSGNPQGRPAGLPAGSIYIEHGNALCTQPDQTEMTGLPGSFMAAVIGSYYGRTFWAPDEKINGKETGNKLYPEGYPEDRRGPICRSMDRAKGVFYDSCKTCPYNPNKTRGEDMGCKDDGTLFLMLPDFTVIRVPLTGSSARILEHIDKKAGQWPARYAFFMKFSVEAKQSADKKNNWKAWAVDVARTVEHKNGVPTSPGFRAVAQIFARKIQTEWYYPALADTYDQAAREAQNRMSGTPGEKQDGESDAAKAMRAAQAQAESENM